ncbi:protein transport protein S31 [Tulasnella sp. 403]|nr:protein transport protein S31 [Tulasnella sp. 403]
MKLKEIHRTSTFVWSPFSSLPLLATGTVSGALDASFSNDSQLEIWDPDFLSKTDFDLGDPGQPGPKGFATINSRFNRLVWGHVSDTRPKGVIASGMENGELGLWDPASILEGRDPSTHLILRNTTHSGPVRALGFNNIQTNLLASGATDGEIFIWDLNNPTKPYSPGNRSSRLDDVTSLAWNAIVPQILSTASSSGFNVVWDLRAKKEVVALAYGGGAATTGGPIGGAFAQGGRRGMSDVAWHPDNATRLVTSSEDDSSPIIMVWDLRNARAPEKILSGHEKGVLSLSWCRQDADLLLSCGKDNRTLCWNPQTSELIGELPPANNWSFQVQWCPRNPDLLATASFDGTVGIHSLQSTNEADTTSKVAAPQADGADVFSTGNFGIAAAQATLSLKQPPKWLRRPTSASFGFAGQLATVSNLPSAQGGHQSATVHLRTVSTEPTIIDRAKKLQEAADGQKLSEFAQDKSTASSQESALEGWKALLSLFQANTRDELVTLLGFSKEEIAAHVAEAIKKVKASATAQPSGATPSTNVIPPEPEEEDVTESKPYEPVVSFAEPEREPEPLSEPTEGPPPDAETATTGPVEPTPSEVSASALSDNTKGQEVESTATEPSLFGDDVAIGTPQGDANADFFASIGTVRSALPEHVLVPHHSYAVDSSVAATVGSRPSSAASESLKTNTFKIYPNEESEIDRLLTKSLVLGDFESAVSLCLSVERYADAILLAVKGGPELLQRTQTTYFTRQTTSLPYLRLYQSIVTNDLTDIVQNADLREWQEIFVILCTFAREDEFSGLAKQLGQRLEFQGKISKAADPQNASSLAKDYKKNATLCYLAAGRLEQVVNIWIEEMREEETLYENAQEKGISRYTAHALALQTFIEKVTVFRSATNYVDADLTGTPVGDNVAAIRSYKLAALYDRYYEYADLLAAQGMLKEAVKFLSMTPADYKGVQGGAELDFDIARERVLSAANVDQRRSLPKDPFPIGQAQTQPAQQQRPQVAKSSYPPQPVYGGAAPSTTYSPVSATKPSPYESAYAPPNGSTAAPTVAAPSVHNPYAPLGAGTNAAGASQQPYTMPTSSTYAPNNAYGGTYTGQSYNAQQPTYGQPSTPLAPPPASLAPPPPRAPPKRTDQGWNDTPVVDTSRRGTPAVGGKAPAAITSPFPSAQPTNSGSPTSPYLQSGQALAPPPSRGGSQFPPNQLQAPPQQQGPPPPRAGSAMGRPPPPPGPGHQGQFPPPGRAGPHNPPPFVRPASAGAAPLGVTYPTRAMSPRSGGGPYAQERAMSPLAQGHPGRPPMAQPPQGQFNGPPPQQRGPGGPPHPPHQGMPPRGTTATPPGRGPPGPYAPPAPIGPGAAQSPYSQPHAPVQPPPGQGFVPPPPGPGSRMVPAGGIPHGPPPVQAPHPGPSMGGAPPPPKPAPPAAKAPKYRNLFPAPGDRSHIPDDAKPSFMILSEALNRFRQTTPPAQKRMVDDVERRVNVLFDALNCETVSKPILEQLHTLTQAMEQRDPQAALATHVDMLTRASATDDIALWMSGVKMLIMRM